MLSDNIKTVRKNRGFTQEDLASRLHVTRQTVSKWEKGYSVPDAEMLSRMAEVFEVPVAELLGGPAQPSADPDAVVEQLARLNEQLVIRNRRSARRWKIVGIVLAVLVVLYIAVAVSGIVLFRAEPRQEAGTVEWAVTMDGETYTCGVNFDKNYRIIAGSTELFIDERVDILAFSDARDAQAALYEWAAENGGMVEVIRQTGLPLPAALP